MLDQMINFTLDTSLHYFPQFFPYLCAILSPQTTLVHSLVTGFLTLWNENQRENLEYYFATQSEIGPSHLHNGPNILYDHFRILPGLAWSLIQSPSIQVGRQNHMGQQVSPVFPVCPSCERHISYPNEGVHINKLLSGEYTRLVWHHMTLVISASMITMHSPNILALVSLWIYPLNPFFGNENTYFGNPDAFINFQLENHVIFRILVGHMTKVIPIGMFIHILLKMSWRIRFIYPPKILSSGLWQICLNLMRRPARLCVAHVINSICNICCLLYAGPLFRKLF